MNTAQSEAASRRHDAAQAALEGLLEIDKLELSIFQRYALAFAIGEVRRIMEEENRIDPFIGAIEHMVNGLQHVREMGQDWSPDQRQAFINGLELTGRKAIGEVRK